jgi:hypothetical protein
LLEQNRNIFRLSTAELAPRAPRATLARMSSLRMPQSLARRLGVETGEAVLRYELLEEQAVSLGRAGHKLEAALAALAAHDGEGREAALKAAADAAWGFLVQREALGLRDRVTVVAQYGVPREVLVRIGAR